MVSTNVAYAVCTTHSSVGVSQQDLKSRHNEWQEELFALFAGSKVAQEAANVVAMFAAVADLKASQDIESVREIVEAAISTVWMADRYEDEFKKAPELDAMTTTPFMLEIVTQVLPKLSSAEQSTRSVKLQLTADLSEVAADMVWHHLRASTDGMDLLGDEARRALSRRLDADSPTHASDQLKFHSHVYSLASSVAREVVESMTEKPAIWVEKCPCDLEGEVGADVEKLSGLVRSSLFRALRIRPTSRAALYILFVDEYIERGFFFGRPYQRVSPPAYPNFL
jgi:hypothetical protein